MGQDAAQVRAGIAVQVGYRIDEIRREDGLVLQFSRGEVVVYVLVVSAKAHTEGIEAMYSLPMSGLSLSPSVMREDFRDEVGERVRSLSRSSLSVQ